MSTKRFEAQWQTKEQPELIPQTSSTKCNPKNYTLDWWNPKDPKECRNIYELLLVKKQRHHDTTNKQSERATSGTAPDPTSACRGRTTLQEEQEPLLEQAPLLEQEPLEQQPSVEEPALQSQQPQLGIGSSEEMMAMILQLQAQMQSLQQENIAMKAAATSTIMQPAAPTIMQPAAPTIVQPAAPTIVPPAAPTRPYLKLCRFAVTRPTHENRTDSKNFLVRFCSEIFFYPF